jgi:hypothetical protein
MTFGADYVKSYRMKFVLIRWTVITTIVHLMLSIGEMVISKANHLQKTRGYALLTANVTSSIAECFTMILLMLIYRPNKLQSFFIEEGESETNVSYIYYPSTNIIFS